MSASGASAFGLVPAERMMSQSAGAPATAGSRRHATYLDYTIDGVSLTSLLAADSELATITSDYVGCIADAWPSHAVQAIRRLLGEAPGELPDGRVSLYICAECGDLGCGALTASLTVTDDTVTWGRLALQYDYDDEVHPVRRVGELIFDRPSYESVLRERLAALAPIADAAGGRRAAR